MDGSSGHRTAVRPLEDSHLVHPGRLVLRDRPDRLGLRASQGHLEENHLAEEAD